jgi:long-chain acyl-CoA synthetase
MDEAHSNGSDTTLPQLLERRAAEYGERVALRKKDFGLWQETTWRAYAERAHAVSRALLAFGVPSGECVALISENRPEWLFVDLGIQSIGAITAAIYVTSAPEQVAYVMAHSRSRVIFVEDQEQLDKLLARRGELPLLERIVVFDWTGLRGFDDPQVVPFEAFLERGDAEVDLSALVAATRAEDTALLVYTSGTTGPPKGAMLTHENLIWTSRSLAEANTLNASDEVLSFLPLCHIAERLMTVVNQLVHGYTVNFAESLDTVPQNLAEVSPHVLFAVPRIWEKFASRVTLTMKDAVLPKRLAFAAALRVGREVALRRERGEPLGMATRLMHHLALGAVFHPLKKRLGLERVRLAISGAAPISPDVLRFFHAIGLDLLEVYGQTEGSGPTCIHRRGDIRIGSVGRALPGVEVRIGDDGEILVRGPNVFAGYLHDAGATATTLREGILHSGDMGELDEEGFLRITDRMKDIIITAGGKNIAPQNIENRLKFSPYINDAVVIGDRRPFLTALIVIDEENVADYAQENRIPFTTFADLTLNEAIRELIAGEVKGVNKALAAVERVKKFEILDRRLEEEDGEVTPTMKVKRSRIAELYADTVAGMYRR